MCVTLQYEIYFKKPGYIVICKVFSKTTHTQAQIHWKITHQNFNRKYWCMVGFSFLWDFWWWWWCILQIYSNEPNSVCGQKITITEGAVQDGLGSGKTGGSEGISNSHVTHEMALNWNRVGSKSSRGIAGGQTINEFPSETCWVGFSLAQPDRDVL